MKNIAITPLILTIIIASVIGNMLSQKLRSLSYHNNNQPTQTLHTEHTNYTVSRQNNKLNIKTQDNTTGKETTYNINMLELIPNLDPQQKLYLTKNKELCVQAAQTYGFIISYKKAINYCKNIYPMNKLKQAYEHQFKREKLKAEYILNKAFGANILDTALFSNADFLKISHQQIDEDYQKVKQMAAEEGVTEFPRHLYCKMIDDSAEEIAKEEYEKFKSMLPNF